MDKTEILNLFSIFPRYSWRTNIKKSDITVPEGGTYKIASVNGQKGRLGQVSVNLDSQTAIRLVIETDHKRLVNHTPEDVEDTGAGDMAFEIPNALTSLLQTTKSAANNYSISFMGHLIKCDFRNSLEVYLVNDSSGDVDLHALYAIWGILTGGK